MAVEVSFGLLAVHPQCQSIVAQWLRSEWPSWYGAGGPGNAEEDVHRYCQVDQLPLGVLAFADGVPCAFGSLKEDNVPGFEHATPWLGAGYVVPELRGRGIGLGLVRALEGEAARLGYTSPCCATSTAHSLMARAGWSYAGASSLGGSNVAIFQKAP
jgi:GNAT superfamily N-acetyltransferase